LQHLFSYYFWGLVFHAPPPANQLLFVTPPKPYKSAGLNAPVNMIGMIGSSSQSTQLAVIFTLYLHTLLNPMELSRKSLRHKI
jgi:hypothetical protein